jgi:hypothetical protein
VTERTSNCATGRCNGCNDSIHAAISWLDIEFDGSMTGLLTILEMRSVTEDPLPPGRRGPVLWLIQQTSSFWNREYGNQHLLSDQQKVHMTLNLLEVEKS